jgi:hypothetical protein
MPASFIKLQSFGWIYGQIPINGLNISIELESLVDLCCSEAKFIYLLSGMYINHKLQSFYFLLVEHSNDPFIPCDGHLFHLLCLAAITELPLAARADLDHG